ncbi:hypothetical protein ACIQMJ_37425 [Actinosynnema sp. NPDC091369]
MAAFGCVGGTGRPAVGWLWIRARSGRGSRGDVLVDLAVLTLGRREHLDDVPVEHGFDSFSSGREVEVPGSRL